MQRMLNILLVSLTLLLACAGGAAAAPPAFPATYYGVIDSANVGPDMEVVAMVDMIACGSAKVHEHPPYGYVYVLDVLPDDPSTLWRDGGLDGDIVRFSLVSPYGDMYPLVQSAIWEGGASQKVNLSDRVAVVLPLIVTQ